MNDAFGKVAAMLLAAVVLCGMPVVYMQERAKTATQMYLLSESTRFVDSVCNIGFISQGMLQQFYQNMQPVNGICRIFIMHETKELAFVDGEDAYEPVSTFYDEKDILKQLEQGKHYEMAKNDFLRVTVCVDGGLRLFPWQKDRTENVCYGGVIRYEAD